MPKMTSPLLPTGPVSVVREEVVSLAGVRRICSMFSLDSMPFSKGAMLPKGWQFILMAADTPRSELRTDGFPGLGVPMPDLGLPRLVLGGREVTFHADIPIGATVTRESRVVSIQQKQSANGPLAIVTIHHAIKAMGTEGVALEEQQTYVMLSASKSPAPAPVPARDTTSLVHAKCVIPDDTLLFQYSALGFNSHKIHLDRDYATGIEGYPDLVVNGGLINLIMTEFLRTDLKIEARRLKTRHTSPAFANRPIILDVESADEKHVIRALNEKGAELAQMEVFTK